MAAPRVLKLTIEFHIPEGLRADVRTARIQKAVTRMSGAIEAMAGDAFPWADRLRITNDWSYRWWNETEEIQLPRTDANTVVDPTSPDEEASMVANA